MHFLSFDFKAFILKGTGNKLNPKEYTTDNAKLVNTFLIKDFCEFLYTAPKADK